MNAKIQKWLKDRYPLHFAGWKKGKYSQVILCTFEDWEKGKAKVHEAPGVKVERLFDEDGQSSSLILHALPQEEYEKISKQKKRLADEYITQEIEWWKGAFRMGCIASKEPEWYLGQEIKRVTEALEDPEKGFFNSVTGCQLVIGAAYSETSDKAHPDHNGKTFNNEFAYYHYHTWKAPAKGLRYWDDFNLNRYREWKEHGRQLNTVSSGCDARILAHYREHLKEWKENPPFDRWELIRGVIQGIVKQDPGTEMFADEKSVNRVHLPRMEREYQTEYYPAYRDAPSPEDFRRELTEDFRKLEEEIKAAYQAYSKADKGPGHRIDLNPEHENKDNDPRRVYLYTLFKNRLKIRFLKSLFSTLLEADAESQAEQITTTEADNLTTWQRCMYYRYLLEGGATTPFSNDRPKKEAYNELAKRHGKSWEHWRNTWGETTKLRRKHESKRKKEGLKKVLKLLEEYPDAYRLCEMELRNAGIL